MPKSQNRTRTTTSLIIAFVAGLVVLLLAETGLPPTTPVGANPQDTVSPRSFLPNVVRPAPTTTPTRTATAVPGGPTATLPPSNGALVVNHQSVALFDQIPASYLIAARNISMLFINRSVGSNINDGLNCLAVPVGSAPNSCRRHAHPVAAYSVSPSEVSWSGSYPRPNWHFGSWPGTNIPPEINCGVPADYWYNKLDCFIRFVDANPNAYQVVSYQNSYLEVSGGSDIASPTTGFFAAQPGRMDVTDLAALQARHPNTRFIFWTSSLARSVGTQESTNFNHQMRAYALTHGEILFDVADIEAHTPGGQPCYDNRDGVPYTLNPNQGENHPSDGHDYPAICQQYTSEPEGGHLGNVSAGKIRIAKAFWVLMARIAGWNP